MEKQLTGHRKGIKPTALLLQMLIAFFLCFILCGCTEKSDSQSSPFSDGFQEDVDELKESGRFGQGDRPVIYDNDSECWIWCMDNPWYAYSAGDVGWIIYREAVSGQENMYSLKICDAQSGTVFAETTMTLAGEKSVIEDNIYSWYLTEMSSPDIVDDRAIRALLQNGSTGGNKVIIYNADDDVYYGYLEKGDSDFAYPVSKSLYSLICDNRSINGDYGALCFDTLYKPGEDGLPGYVLEFKGLSFSLRELGGEVIWSAECSEWKEGISDGLAEVEKRVTDSGYRALAGTEDVSSEWTPTFNIKNIIAFDVSSGTYTNIINPETGAVFSEKYRAASPEDAEYTLEYEVIPTELQINGAFETRDVMHYTLKSFGTGEEIVSGEAGMLIDNRANGYYVELDGNDIIDKIKNDMCDRLMHKYAGTGVCAGTRLISYDPDTDTYSMRYTDYGEYAYNADTCDFSDIGGYVVRYSDWTDSSVSYGKMHYEESYDVRPIEGQVESCELCIYDAYGNTLIDSSRFEGSAPTYISESAESFRGFASAVEYGDWLNTVWSGFLAEAGRQ